MRRVRALLAGGLALGVVGAGVLGAGVAASGSVGASAVRSGAVAGGAAGDPAGYTAVVVQSPGATRAARAAVTRLGGRVGTPLPLVDGFAARVPAHAVDDLARQPGVLAVTPDERLRPMGGDDSKGWEDDGKRPFGNVYKAETGVERLRRERGVTGTYLTGPRSGRGVTVALVDTGVTPVADLAGRLVPVQDPADPEGGTVACVNFSGEPTCDDTYGHGTFVAGLIAGTGVSSQAGTSPDGLITGVAPTAQIVSIKIAGRDGSADVSKVLAAIQWAVSFRDTYDIRVLNLSLGTDSRRNYRTDPLNYAVERAWRAGIVVVVSAGNRGTDPNGQSTISKPADDPLVISVGAVDDRGTVTRDDDLVPPWASRDSATVTDRPLKPDVAAPGARVISTRSASSSTIEQAAPGGDLSGTPYRRGSGTSMSAGIVSGVSALVVAAHHDWQPDQVKYALRTTASPVAGGPLAVGTGLVDAYAAAVGSGLGRANQDVTVLSDGLGALDPSRGLARVTGAPCLPFEEALNPDCEAVEGEETAQGHVYRQREYAQSEWTGSSWYESQWVADTVVNGSSWYGSSWYGSSWYGSSWYGYGTSLEGSSWYGAWN